MFLLLANNNCNMQILNRRSGDEAQRRQALSHRCANTPQSISRAAGGKHLSTNHEKQRQQKPVLKYYYIQLLWAYGLTTTTINAVHCWQRVRVGYFGGDDHN